MDSPSALVLFEISNTPISRPDAANMNMSIALAIIIQNSMIYKTAIVRYNHPLPSTVATVVDVNIPYTIKEHIR